MQGIVVVILIIMCVVGLIKGDYMETGFEGFCEDLVIGSWSMYGSVMDAIINFTEKAEGLWFWAGLAAFCVVGVIGAIICAILTCVGAVLFLVGGFIYGVWACIALPN